MNRANLSENRRSVNAAVMPFQVILDTLRVGCFLLYLSGFAAFGVGMFFGIRSLLK